MTTRIMQRLRLDIIHQHRSVIRDAMVEALAFARHDWIDRGDILPLVRSCEADHLATVTLPSSELWGRNGTTLDDAVEYYFDSLTATFRSPEQAMAVHLVANLKSIAFYAPCDAGKSLAYLLPIVTLDPIKVGEFWGVTVLISPYSTLAHDVLRRCGTGLRKIPATIWTPDSPLTNSLMIVVADTAMSDGFKQALWGLQKEGQLMWIVFDEVHCFITEVSF